MKFKVYARFIFHNIGQGMFYTGDIYTDKHLFRFVYDCGASPSVKILRTAIRRYRHDIVSDPRIDLLILSHLHRDHVNGLDELIGNFEIKRVILPYLLPIERLFIAVLESRIRTSAWYFTFLQDPARFLLENGVEQVIFIGGEEDNGNFEESGEGPPPPEFPREGEIRIELKDDRRLIETIQENEKDRRWGELLRRGAISVKTHHGHIIGAGLWIFKLFNYKIPYQDFQGFKNCIKSISCLNLKQCIIDPYLRSKLYKCYTQHMRSLGRNENQRLNNTSLVVYHAPWYSRESFILIPHLYSCYYHNWNICVMCRECVYLKRYGHFLTGDIDLNFKYNEFLQHFKENINKVCIFNVPHHGAERNWNARILKDISAPIWVASASLNNRYGHPSLKVIEEVLDHGRCTLWVNEKFPLIIRQEVYW